MNKINYQLEMEKVIKALPDRRRRLFLHSCCAPCSSYCLECLREHFSMTVFYYNPNISREEEYRLRAQEQKRLIEGMKDWEIDLVEGAWEPERFFGAVKGLESCPEGGARCSVCYELRLRETARQAAKGGYDYFATTLTISPLKDAEKLNEIGRRLASEYGVAWLPSDFKKKGGYQRSIALSREYGLYRQDYCGCVFSKKEREKLLAEKLY